MSWAPLETANKFELQEVVARHGDAHAAIGFAFALAAVRGLAAKSTRATLLCVREAAAAAETGDYFGHGLISFGLSPDRMIIVNARTKMNALRAALEGARCEGLDNVILETATPVDLTASRKLKLAAEKSGVGIVLVRLTDVTTANAAQVRWRVEAARSLANPKARSSTVFKVEILKHPAGLIGSRGVLEWDNARHCFAQAIPLSLATVSDIGSLAA